MCKRKIEVLSQCDWFAYWAESTQYESEVVDGFLGNVRLYSVNLLVPRKLAIGMGTSVCHTLRAGRLSVLTSAALSMGADRILRGT